MLHTHIEDVGLLRLPPTAAAESVGPCCHATLTSIVAAPYRSSLLSARRLPSLSIRTLFYIHMGVDPIPFTLSVLSYSYRLPVTVHVKASFYNVWRQPI